MKKKLSKLSINKKVVSKLSASKVTGGGTTGDMTSCNGGCSDFCGSVPGICWPQSIGGAA